MELTIKYNEALVVLATTTGMTIKDLESHILKTFIDNEWIINGVDDCGWSIQYVIGVNELDTNKVIKALFPEEPFHPEDSEMIMNTEIPELLKSIFFWGDETVDPCPDCGCEVERESDSTDGISWENVECSNCDYSTSDEPDWDSMPGGRDDI